MAYPPPPYADAVCGTFVCGEALCGAWWAYPSTSGLGFGATPPNVEVIVPDQVPSAGLGLGATAPGLSYGDKLAPPSAGLGLGATAPAIRISSRIIVLSAGLGFGAIPPDAIGVSLLTPAECLDLDLVADSESDLVLVGAGSIDIVLDPQECL